jgi:hypothetical protein
VQGFGERTTGHGVGEGAGQQPVEDDAKRIHVAGRRDRLPAQLFGARERRREHRVQGRRLRVLGADALREQLRDAEVQQLHLTVGGDEDVRGLQVAMNHEVPVRVVHGGADGAEQRQPLLDGEPFPLAVGVDRLAFHILHGEVRLPLVARAPVEDGRDVGMLQPGQDLALDRETPQVLRGRAPAHELQGHGLPEDVVVADGAIDEAHAAFAGDGEDAVGPDAAALEAGIQRLHESRDGEELAGPFVRGQQRLDLLT